MIVIVIRQKEDSHQHQQHPAVISSLSLIVIVIRQKEDGHQPPAPSFESKWQMQYLGKRAFGSL